MSLLSIFKDKKVLVTGHTGFKGSWLSMWLNHLGAKVVGASIAEPSVPSNFSASFILDVVEDHRIDILDIESLKKVFGCPGFSPFIL